MFSRVKSFFSPENLPLLNTEDLDTVIVAVNDEDISKEINYTRNLLEQIPIFIQNQHKNYFLLGGFNICATLTSVALTFAVMYCLHQRREALAAPLLKSLKPLLHDAQKKLQKFINHDFLDNCNLSSFDDHWLDSFVNFEGSRYDCTKNSPNYYNLSRIPIYAFDGTSRGILSNYCDIELTETASEECRKLAIILCKGVQEFLKCYNNAFIEFDKLNNPVKSFQNEINTLEATWEPISTGVFAFICFASMIGLWYLSKSWYNAKQELNNEPLANLLLEKDEQNLRKTIQKHHLNPSLSRTYYINEFKSLEEKFNCYPNHFHFFLFATTEYYLPKDIVKEIQKYDQELLLNNIPYKL